MNKTKTAITIFATLFMLLISACTFTACSSDSDNDDTETVSDYPVAGIWHAQASWNEDNPYNYGGDTYILNIWFDFMEDGTLKNKRTLSLNGYTFSDSYSDWFIVNLTWTVKGNVISLSSGKKYVISDDEFDDTYTNPQIVLHYKKETA